MAKHSDYNGWTNYATWRIHLEIFDGYETDSPVTADWCEEYATELVESSAPEGLARDYALAFLSDVDWREIAESVNETNGVEEDSDDDSLSED